MKSEKFNYLYFLFGVLCGFLLGSSLEPQTGVWVRRVLAGIALCLVALFWRRTEAKSHRYHLEQWEELRLRGRWFFVITRYLLLRGIVLIVIFGGSAIFETWYAAPLLFLVAILVPLLLYLGVQEWNDCEKEFEIQSLRQTAEFISLKQN
jgi:hypothetical protein